jgi:cell division protein FtsI (penicillin-binding protein 3)
MNRSELISRRIGYLLLAVAAIVALFIGRLFWIQIVDGPRLSQEARDRQSMVQTLYGTRGSILDTNGVTLAESVERYDITASPKFVSDFKRDGAPVTIQQALIELATATGGDQGVMNAAITNDPTSDFAYLVKGVTIDVLRTVQDLKIPWVYNDLRPSRTYPRGSVAGNLVGFMGTDGPLTGVEYYVNDCLKATNGSSTYERGADGIKIPGSTLVHTEAVSGGTVRLTIDSDLQWFAQQTLATEAGKLRAQWATAIIVRVSDGHILAAADWPTVDPNNVDGSKVDDMGSRLFSSPYEPGSIIKPLVVAGMLNTGVITPTTTIIAPGRFKIPGGGYIKDSFSHGDLSLTTAGVLVQSSNTGIDTLSLALTKKQRYDILTSWGLGSTTPVGFLGEDSGLVVSPDVVDDVTQFTELFGQGMTVTSAQMAQAYQILANGGTRMPLTLVESCSQPDGTVTSAPTEDSRQVVSQDTAETTVRMMENVARYGSASRVVKVPGYRIAVKTGTAEVARNGKYTSDRIISVAGIAPADNPQYVVIVTIGMPKVRRSSYYAGPAFATLMGQVLKYYRVAPSTGKFPAMDLGRDGKG